MGWAMILGGGLLPSGWGGVDSHSHVTTWNLPGIHMEVPGWVLGTLLGAVTHLECLP